MWKNDKENDRGRRRIRGRKRRERERERRKKRIQKRDENRTPHASRGITSCIIVVACNLAILIGFAGIFIRGLL